MRNISFDDKDLEQFTPQVAEALFRLSRQQEEIAARQATPFMGQKLTITKRGPTQEESRKKAASQMKPDGTRILPDMAEGSQPWRKPT